MGCILACFRIKEDGQRKNRPISRWIPFKSKGCLVSKKRRAPMTIFEESGRWDEDRWELMHEVKFRKGCGAEFETPQEIRKQFEKRIARTLEEDDLSSNFCSWSPWTSSKKLLCDEQHDKLTLSPKQLHEDSSFQENNSASFQDNDLVSVTSSKSMHSHGAKQQHYSEVEARPEPVTLDTFRNQTDGRIKPSGSSRSPHPTPLKLSDEMQTPLTVHPASLENNETRRNARVRTQYVYQVLNHAKNLPWWRTQSENSGQLGTHFEQQSPGGKDNPSIVAPTLDGRERAFLSPENPQLVDSILSRRLMPQTVTKENFHFGIPPTDNGGPCNGIPNTTSKYKEDQKVHWHGTPFEERLKKVLSDDKLSPRRKL